MQLCPRSTHQPLDEEGLGLVAGTRVPRHPRRTSGYEITEAGRAALLAWVDSPTLPTAKTKNDLLVKVFMARHARPERLEPLLRAYRESVELDLADLQAIVDQLADRARARFGSLTARWGILHAEASLAWLDEAEALVATQYDTAPKTGDSVTREEAAR